MDVKDLQEFFADKPAQIGIDFVQSEKNDCMLKVSVSIGNEEFMSMKYDLPFSEADGFIKELQTQVDQLK